MAKPLRLTGKYRVTIVQDTEVSPDHIERVATLTLLRTNETRGVRPYQNTLAVETSDPLERTRLDLGRVYVIDLVAADD